MSEKNNFIVNLTYMYIFFSLRVLDWASFAIPSCQVKPDVVELVYQEEPLKAVGDFVVSALDVFN